MFIDTHCHIQLNNFDEDRTAVIGNAKKAGVKQCIVPGVDYLSSNLAVAMALEHSGTVFAAAGYHPYEAAHRPDTSHLTTITPIVAIGEIGLDYHLFKGEDAKGKKQEQCLLFDEQLRIAVRRNLPVIMHCRDAFEDFFHVLDSLSQMPRGVIHCFSGGLQELRETQRRNLMIGIDGNCTYSKFLQGIIPHIPRTMMLLETDAPYLTPVPNRGKRNEPKYIPTIAAMIANLTNTNKSEIEHVTTENARRLFTLAVV